MTSTGTQHSGNWERKRPSEGGGWETLYDENNHPYFYSHYTSAQTYELPPGVPPPAGYKLSMVPVPIDSGQHYSPMHGHYWGREHAFEHPEDHNMNGEQQIVATSTDHEHYEHEEGQDEYGTHDDSAGVPVYNEWIEEYDEEGNTYYTNTSTGESSWEPPPGFGDVYDDGNHMAATSIQRIIRGAQGRKIASAKQELFDRMNSIHDDAVVDKTEYSAALKVQSFCRMGKEKRNFKRKRHSAIKIQSQIRKQLATRNSKVLADMAPVLARLHAGIVEHQSLYGSPIKDVQDLFFKMDKDGDGKISFGDFRQGMDRLDIGMADDQMKALMWAMNSHSYSKDTKITFDHFCRSIKVGESKYDALSEAASLAAEALDDSENDENVTKNDTAAENSSEEEEGDEIDEDAIDVEEDDEVDEEESEADNDDDQDDSVEGEESETEEVKPGKHGGKKKKKLTARQKQQLKAKEDRQKRALNAKQSKKNIAKDKKKAGSNSKARDKGTGTPSARPPVPKIYHEEFEVTGVNDMGDSLKRTGFVRLSKGKLLKRIEDDANDGDAYRQLGFLLHEQGKYKESVKKLQRAIGMGYKNGRVWRTMGHCFFEVNQVDNAREAYGRALMHKSNDTSLLMFYRAARMEMRRGEYGVARTLLRKIEASLTKFKDKHYVLFSLGVTSYFEKDYSKAIDYFKRCLTEKPKIRGSFKRAAFYCMARCFELLEKYTNRNKYDKLAGKALPVTKDGEEDSGDDSVAVLSDDAEEPEGQNLLDPNGDQNRVKKGDFHVTIATFLLGKSFFGSAIVALDLALQFSRTNPEWLSRKAFALHEQGQVKKATRVGERAQKLAVKSGDEWRANASPFSPSLKTQLPAWRLEAVPPSPDVVISSYSPRSRPSSAGSTRTGSRPSSAVRRGSRPSTAGTNAESFRTPRGGFRLSDEDIARLVEEVSKSVLASQTPIKEKPKVIEKKIMVHTIATQMTPRGDFDEGSEGSQVGSDFASENQSVGVDEQKTPMPMVDSWVGRSQKRVARVAALAARATKALASALALGDDDAMDEGVLNDLEHGIQNSGYRTPSRSPRPLNAMSRTSGMDSAPDSAISSRASNGPQSRQIVAPVSPVTLGKMRDSIVTGPVTIVKSKPKTEDPKVTATRELKIAKAVFDRLRPDDDGTIDKHFFLDTLEVDFEIQEFIRAHSYSMVHALFLRKVHLKTNRGASKFERNKRVTWEDVEDYLANKIHTSAKGARVDNGDSYDPRFAGDSEPVRGQKERAEIAAREAAEKKAKADAIAKREQLALEAKLNDWPDEYKELDPAPGEVTYESVQASDLDHKISWQGPVHKKAEEVSEPVDPWRDPMLTKEREEKRQTLLADLSIAKTNSTLRDLEAKQQIARMEEELRSRNMKSKAAMAVAEREGCAAAVAALASNVEAVTREVDKHITNIEEKLAMRRARQDARSTSYAQHVAMKHATINPATQKQEKKIFVAGDDVEMRMLFADYEHGTNVRLKINEIKTVHPHVSEEEAFLALAETGGDVDLAIGKLTDLRFYRDLSAVSNLQKEAEAGQVLHATSTALSDGPTAPGHSRHDDMVYKKFQIFRKSQEKANEENAPVERLAGNKRVLPPKKVGKGIGRGSKNSNDKGSAFKTAKALAESPYLSVRPRRKKEDSKKKRRKPKRGMADALPGHISAALKADNRWRARGGERRRINRPVGQAPSLRAASGHGARAAKLLQHNKVSKYGAFGGVNPTIDNPTPEYKAVIFAASELKPIPAKIFEYKSEYRVMKPHTGSSMSEDVQALSNLA